MSDLIPSEASASSSEPGGPPEIPGYQLLRRIGRGSYGEVWLARDGAGEFRAVKVVFRKTFEHDRPFEREMFGIQKFEPISRTHPSQVSILHVGQNLPAGFFYYAMELADDATAGQTRVEGGALDPNTYLPKTLKSVLGRRERLPFRDCLDIGLALTTALEHLHGHGLIHRDIKPSNVIFVNGVPKLADIGLVTDADASISFVGTEGFLPPEGPGTPQADVYSLGKVLYEMGTGRDRMEFPELPTFVDETDEKEHLLELNQVFLKACQNDVRKRYRSAAEMFSDLKLLKSGRSLRRARSSQQKLVRIRLVGTAAMLVVLGGMLVDHFIQQQRVRQVEQENAQQKRDAGLERTANTNITRRLADGYVANGNKSTNEGDYFGALVWYTKAWSDDITDPTRAASHRHRAASMLEKCPRLSSLFTHPGGVNSTDFSSDGRRVVSAGEDQIAQVWDAQTGEPLGVPLQHSGRVTHAELSSNGERALTLSEDGTVQIWSGLAIDPIAARLEHGSPFVKARFSPSSRQVLTTTDGPDALIWEAGSGRVRFTLNHRGRVVDAVFSPDERHVATVSADGQALVWSTETGAAVSRITIDPGAIASLGFSPDSRRLTMAAGPQARVWDIRSGEPAPFTLVHDAIIRSVSFRPDGRQMATAGEDRTLRVWDAATGQLLGPPLWHKDPVNRAIYSPDGRFIAAASGNSVQLWNAITLQPWSPTLVQNATVRDIRFSPGGDCLLLASADGTARGWRFPRSSENRVQPGAEHEDYLAWAQLLAGRQISNEEMMLPVSTETVRQLWRTLRSRYPGEFAAMDLVEWHRSVAETCEQAQNWFGAGFHWERASLLKPGEAAFRDRRERSAMELARWEAAAARKPERLRRIPARAPETSERLVDLSNYYNAPLTETWLPSSMASSGNDLSALPCGIQKFGEALFDVRGLIQLNGGALKNHGGGFPRQVDGIPLNQTCRRLHFLHGAAWSDLFGTRVGNYVVRYTDGTSREIRIVFGQNVREWWFVSTQPQLTSGAGVAWQGSNPASRAVGMSLRIYQFIWINPTPEVPVASLDFQSTMENSAPFLIAITAD